MAVTIPPHLKQALQQEADRQNCTLQELLASEEELPYKKFFELSADMLVVAQDERFTHVNTTMVQKLGYSLNVLLQTPFMEFVHPDDRDVTTEAMAKLKRSKPILHFVNRYRRADGQYLWFEWMSTPTEDGTIHAVVRDVTHTKLIERELANRSHELMTILESIPDAFFALDHEWRFTYVNVEAEHLLVRHAVDLIGNSIWVEFPDAIDSTFYKQYHLAVETQQTVTFTEFYPPLNRWLEVKAQPSSTGISVFFRDVTASKNMEDELRSLNNDLSKRVEQRTTEINAIVNSLPDYIYVIERGTMRILHCNDTFAQSIGFKNRAMVQGKTIYESFPPGKAAYFEKRDLQVMEQGEIFHELDEIHLLGKHYHFDTYKIPLYTSDGEIYALVSASRDITELIHTQQQLDVRTTELEQANKRLAESRKFLQSILDGQSSYIVVIDANGNTLMTNAAWKEAGARNQASDELTAGVGLNYFEVCEQAIESGAAEVGYVLRGIRRVAAGEREQITYEYHFPTPSGEQWFNLIATRFLSEGKPHVVLSHQDITERKTVELRIQQALERETHLSDLKSRFLALAAHEFRTPLAIIQTSVDLLNSYGDRINEEKRIAHFNKIKAQIQHLITMMEDISSVESGTDTGYQIRYRPTNLYLLLQQIADKVQIALSHKGEIRIVGDHDQVTFNLDSNLLYQIFANIISNAVKYSDPDSDITIEWHHLIDSQAIQVKVHDNGIGIDEIDRTRLFEAFHRGANVGVVPGLGLGLSIVKQAVDTHHGSIEVQSELNQGTTFTVTIPYVSETHMHLPYS